jgi:hypothetical protein
LGLGRLEILVGSGNAETPRSVLLPAPEPRLEAAAV